MKYQKRNLKGQEEMVGFVVIVVIIVIVGVIFLAISLNQPGNINDQTNNRLDSFLKSVGYYTTDCEITKSQFENVESLIGACYEQKQCTDGMAACEKLGKTLREMLNNSFVVSNNSYVAYYTLELKSMTDNRENAIEFIEPIARGTLFSDVNAPCSGVKFGKERRFSTSNVREKAVMKLVVCYNPVKTN